MASSTSYQGAPYSTPLQREWHVRGWTQQETIDPLKRLAHESGHGHRFDGLDMPLVAAWRQRPTSMPRRHRRPWS